MNVKVSRKWAVDLGLVDGSTPAIPETTATVNVKSNFDDDEKTRVEVTETEW